MTARMVNPESVFVIMPFGGDFDRLYQEHIQPTIDRAGLHCHRADTKPLAGIVSEQIRKEIRDARLCVADLTGRNPNVMLEVGLAISCDKPLILITQDDLASLPFDIAHYRAYRYDPKRPDRLDSVLAASLSVTLNSEATDRELLGLMLAPPSARQDARFVVAASPLSYRAAKRRVSTRAQLRPTFGDHAGIRGLIQGFGIIFGMTRLPELIDPGDFDDGLLTVTQEPMHVFSIASPKSNRWTGLLLNRFFENRTPKLRFTADPDSADLANVHVNVMIERAVGWSAYEPPHFNLKRGQGSYGLVVRGPYPGSDGQMLTVLAGGSALGTHAACLAATTPEHIAKIRKDLRSLGIDLSDHRQSFWAVAEIRERTSSALPHDPEPDTVRVIHVETIR